MDDGILKNIKDLSDRVRDLERRVLKPKQEQVPFLKCKGCNKQAPRDGGYCKRCRADNKWMKSRENK